MRSFVTRAVAAAAVLAASAGGAAAQRIGRPEDGEINLQEPATQVARQIYDLHMLMLVISAAICVFVLTLMLIVVVRYNRAANPTPARWTHNSLVEVIWTAAPVVILVIIAIPSVRLLQLQEDFSQFEPDLVIKATGNQWYWSYEYPDQEISFDALMLGAGQAEMNDQVRSELTEAGYPEDAWKLAADASVVAPVNKKVLVQVTGADVIHAWAVPAFGVKVDAVPGRLNQTWFQAEEEGVYFGQCSELCGKDHAYMPIVVRVVDQSTFDNWVKCVQTADVYSCPVGADLLTSQAEKVAPAGEVAAAAPAAR